MRRKKLKQYSAGIMAVVMSGMLIFGNQTTVFAAEEEKKEDKTETVYVNADADGTTSKVTVSEWLQNHDASDVINDYSTLKNIKNVKGEETFTEKGDGSLEWKAGGSDIYYQGESDQDLPVSMKVSYFLNGKEVTPDQIAGQSGPVKIRFDYYNHTKETVDVEGEKVSVQTPFTMVTAMILPSDTFSDIKVTNGKVISDGDKSIVVGLAFPGLKDSLSLGSYEKLDDLTIPDYVEVSTTADQFELALTATVATSGSLNDIDTSGIDDAGDLSDDLNKLTDAANQLVKGTGDLLKGMENLSSSVSDYTKGVDEADQGAKELEKGLTTLNSKKGDLKKGAISLSEGMKTLKSGTSSLSEGVDSYTEGTDSLTDGIESASEGTKQLKTGAKALSKGLAAYTKGASDLNEGIQKMEGALSEVTLPDEETLKLVNEAASTLEEDAKNLQTLLGELDQAVGGLAELSKTLTGYQKSLVKVNSELNKVDKNATKQVQSQLRDLADKALEQYPEAKKLVPNLDSQIEKAISSVKVEGAAKDAQSTLNEMLKTELPNLSVDVSAISGLLKDMKIQAKVLESFAGQTTDLTNQIPQMTKGVKDLSDGSKALTDHNESLLKGMADLSTGIDTLQEGLTKLSQGAQTLSENSEDLKNGAKAADSGAKKLVNGSKSLSAGIDTFNSGVGQLSEGSEKLSKGTGTLSQAGNQLKDGVGQLKDGAGTLDEGMNEFNEEGISKLRDLAGDDLENVIKHLKAVKKADENYQSFAGMEKNQTGSVKFIIETAAVKAED